MHEDGFYLVRVLLGIGLYGGSCTAVRVALTQHRVDSAAKDLEEEGSGGGATGCQKLSIEIRAAPLAVTRHFGDSGPLGDAVTPQQRSKRRWVRWFRLESGKLHMLGAGSPRGSRG